MVSVCRFQSVVLTEKKTFFRFSYSKVLYCSFRWFGWSSGLPKMCQLRLVRCWNNIIWKRMCQARILWSLH